MPTSIDTTMTSSAGQSYDQKHLVRRWFFCWFPRGALQRRVIAGRPVVMWRTRHGEVVGLDARCVHKCFPLWHGRLLDNDRLECGYHGFESFDSSGRCVAIPALHDERDRIPQAARQIKFPVTEKNGLVWIGPAMKEIRRDRRPGQPEIDGPDWETRNAEPVSVKANYRLLIEIFLI